MNASKYFAALMAATLAVVEFRHIRDGKIDWGRGEGFFTVYRSKEPFSFWFIICFESICVGLLVLSAVVIPWWAGSRVFRFLQSRKAPFTVEGQTLDVSARSRVLATSSGFSFTASCLLRLLPRNPNDSIDHVEGELTVLGYPLVVDARGNGS